VDVIWKILWFLVAVSLLVTVHEFGHYWVARKLGFKVLRFSVGFGKPLLRFVGGADRTEYVLAAIPLGGYVKLLDEREGPIDEAERSRAFTQKHPWQRILVLLAGPAFNIFFAIIVLWAMFWVSGIPEVRAVVGTVTTDSLADQAGLRRGDEILELNGRTVNGRPDVVLGLVEAMSDDGVAALTVRRESGSEVQLNLVVAEAELRRALTEPSGFSRGFGFRFWEPVRSALVGRVSPGGPADRAGLRSGDLILSVDAQGVGNFTELVEIVSSRPGQELLVEYRREGVVDRVRLITEADTVDGRAVGRMRVETPPGTAAPPEMIRTRTFGPLAALGEATVRAWEMTELQAKMFWRMIMGQVSMKNLSGPISIAEFAGDSASGGLSTFLGFLVLISLSLGFLNLLPIPILDGGQIVYQLAEWLKGSPLSDRVQAFGQQVGIALLLLLMGVALFNDVARQIQPG